MFFHIRSLLRASRHGGGYIALCVLCVFWVLCGCGCCVPCAASILQQLLWAIANDLTAAVEKFAVAAVLGEGLQAAPCSSSYCGHSPRTALPQLKNSCCSCSGECLQSAASSSSLCGQSLMTSLPQLKNLLFLLFEGSACSQRLAAAACVGNPS